MYVTMVFSPSEARGADGEKAPQAFQHSEFPVRLRKGTGPAL